MNLIKRNLFLVLFLACSSFCFAKQISFQVVQSNNSDKVKEETYFLEDILISNFFDNGYIATNSSASTANSEETKSALWKSGVTEAINGGAGYFIQIILDFSERNNKIINKKEIFLDSIEYSVTSTDTLDREDKVIDCDILVNNPKNLTVVFNRLAHEIIMMLEA